jgi:tyrosine-protein kinase Etk/Wzc
MHQNMKESPGNEGDLHTASEEPGLLDLLIVFAKRKGMIFLMAVGGGILSLVLAFLIPPTFTATAIIMPPQQQTPTASALLGQLGGVANLASQSLGIKNPTDLYIAILNSRTIADDLIAQFGLKDVYGKKFQADVRKKLANRTEISAIKFTLIQISVEDRSPTRAADLANAYVDRLQAQNSRLALTESSQRRLFFEHQVKEEKELLAQAEADFKQMQEQKGIYQVSNQMTAVIASMAQMRTEIVAREISLQRLSAGATAQNAEVQRQEIELKTLRSKLKELEASSSKRSQGDPLIPTSMMPEAGLEYARRLRDVKYHETVYEFLAKQYEVARIDEAKEAPVIQVVDRAIPPDKRSFPRRSIFSLVGTIFGGVLGVIIALIGNDAQDPAQASKMEALRRSLWISNKS